MALFYYSDGLGQRCASPEHPLLVGLSVDLLDDIVTIRLASPAGAASATIIVTVGELRTILLRKNLLQDEKGKKSE